MTSDIDDDFQEGCGRGQRSDTPDCAIRRQATGLNQTVKKDQPRDALETMPAAQIGALHQATMRMARRLNHIQNISQQDAAERALNRRTRTCTTQMETPKRYRTGGWQTVTVQRVKRVRRRASYPCTAPQQTQLFRKSGRGVHVALHKGRIADVNSECLKSARFGQI